MLELRINIPRKVLEEHLKNSEPIVLSLNDLNDELIIDKSQITISRILHELDIPINIKGYDYLKTMLEIIFKRGKLDKLTSLYNDVAKYHNTTYCAVVRCIKYAIDSCLIDKK